MLLKLMQDLKITAVRKSYIEDTNIKEEHLGVKKLHLINEVTLC